MATLFDALSSSQVYAVTQIFPGDSCDTSTLACPASADAERPGEGDVHALALTRQQHAHTALQATLSLVPSGRSKLFGVLRQHYPHRRLRAEALSDYALQALRVVQYAPLIEVRYAPVSEMVLSLVSLGKGLASSGSGSLSSLFTRMTVSFGAGSVEMSQEFCVSNNWGVMSEAFKCVTVSSRRQRTGHGPQTRGVLSQFFEQ